VLFAAVSCRTYELNHLCGAGNDGTCYVMLCSLRPEALSLKGPTRYYIITTYI
jgi:hypothetical protein